MEIEIRHSPSFAVARCGLAAGEAVKAESGAMMATSHGVAIEAEMQGGLMKGLKRSVLGGESLFITTLTAPDGGGWVDCAAALPGDVAVLEIDDSLNLTRGSWLCSSPEIELDTKWGGFKNLAGGEGGFLVHASGRGKVVVSCYGAIESVELASGEQIVIDSGHLVAFDPSVEYTTRMVAKGGGGLAQGIAQSLKSGEGLVMEFTGPGTVLTQSRDPGTLVSWLTTALPFSRA